jgi:hypothetical protein
MSVICIICSSSSATGAVSSVGNANAFLSVGISDFDDVVIVVILDAGIFPGEPPQDEPKCSQNQNRNLGHCFTSFESLVRVAIRYHRRAHHSGVVI